MKKGKKEGILLFLDFEKAFDTVEWPFLIDVLHKFCFKSNFITWIQTLYRNANVRISNNGWISEPFNIHRGVRQGCPLSALLFLLVAETMATKLRNYTMFHGIMINNITFKITQLADDTTLFLKNECEIPIVLSIIDQFSKVSGLKLNISKTIGLCIGKTNANQINNSHGIKLTNDSIKSLGVYFGNNRESCDHLNWDNKIDNAVKLIDAWKRRKLTMLGKIVVLKSMFLPRLTYLTQNIVTPKNITKRINSIMFNFLWSEKSEKLKEQL